MPTTALCFLVWNEREGCETDLPKIDLTAFDQVYAVDGGSTDGTVEELQRHGVKVYPQAVRSMNAAFHEAVEHCQCDHVLIFFPKGTLDPAILKTMKDLLAQGTELVVPSRMIKGGRNEEDDKVIRLRKWGVEALAIVGALLWCRQGPMIWDVLHGVKGFSKKAFQRMDISPTGMTIDFEMTVRSYRLRISRCEFPVRESSRTYGDTKFKIVPMAISQSKFMLRELFRRS